MNLSLVYFKISSCFIRSRTRNSNGISLVIVLNLLIFSLGLFLSVKVGGTLLFLTI